MKLKVYCLIHNNIKMKQKTLFLLASVLVFILIGCKRQKDVHIVKVGVILPLSGEVASYGNDCREGILYANIADSLGVNYIFEDSKGDPKTAIAAFNKLTTIDNVEYVIGDMFSNTTLSLSPLSKRQQKLLISPTASSKEISKDNIYALSVFPCETYESKIVADFAKSHYSKVGVLYEKIAAAQTMRDAYIENLDNDLLVFDESFESTTTTFREIVYKIKQSGCEALYLITYSNNAIKIINKIKELGVLVDLIGQSALYDPSLLEYLADYKSDFYLTGPLFNMKNTDEMSIKFITGYTEAFNKEPNQMSSQGYVAAIVAKDLYKYIKNRTYSKSIVLGYHNSFFGYDFQFNDDLTSMSGLRLYKYEEGNYNPITNER